MSTACRACKSEKVQEVKAELTASLPTLKAVKVTPLYVCQSALICLECGFTELVIPSMALGSLKDGIAKMDS